jgi:hypothetical protein
MKKVGQEMGKINGKKERLTASKVEFGDGWTIHEKWLDFSITLCQKIVVE